MSGTRTRQRSPAHTTRRERALLQSQAARARQEEPHGVLSRLVGYLRKPTPDTREVVSAARWRTIAALVLSIGGLGVSTYLTVAHYSHTPLACSDSGIVNCEKVTTSAQSVFLGVPVAVWGLAFFVAMVAVNLPAAWRSVDRRVHALRLAMVVVGMCFVLYLVSAELLIIKNICLWCTSVHAITFLLFVLVVATVPQMLGAGRFLTATPRGGWTR
ncbi:MAG: vitamin K epoxide reductase family protein [Acidimicrobiales bacterium]